jgi:hypothetical protein
MLHQSDEFKYHHLSHTALQCGCLLQCPGLGLGFFSKAPGGQRVETQGGGGSRLQIFATLLLLPMNDLLAVYVQTSFVPMITA